MWEGGMTRRWGVCLAMGIAVGALGAEAANGQVAVGVKGGFNASTIAWTPTALGDGPDRLERRRAFSGGLMVTVEGPGPVRFRAEVLSTGKGFSEIEANGDISRLFLDYLEVPLLVGLVAPVSSRVRPEVYAGPWISWETDCDATLEAAFTSLSFDCDDVPGDPVLRKTTDFGFAVGASLTIDGVGPLQGFLDLRYAAGLRNVDDAPAVDNVRAKHRGYGITAGLFLPVGR